MDGTGLVTDGAWSGTATGTWTIDPAHTSVTFSIRHLMSKVRGHFSDVDGRVVIGTTLESCSVEASIPTSTVDTGVRMRDDDLRSATYFDVEHFPAMRFTSTGITAEGDRLSLRGELVIRDVSRPVTIDVDFLGRDETGLQGEPRIGFSGRTVVRRSDFGVGPSSGEGKIVVGNDVTIELDVEAYLAS